MLALYSGLAIFFSVERVFADVLSDRLDDIGDATNESDFAQKVLDFAVPTGILSLFALLFKGAYDLMTSQGNPDKLNEAREGITNAIVGFGLVVMSVAILLLIRDIFSLPI